MKRWQAVLAVLAVFLAGALFGGLVSARIAPVWQLLHLPSREAVVSRINLRLSRQLSLTAEQQREVAAIVDESQNELVGIKKEVEPRVRASILKAQDRIREKLTPEQQAKFDQLVRQRWLELEKSQLFTR